MKTTALAACSLLLMPSLFAVPGKSGAEPVAEGYPAWTGVTPKNYIAGRVLGSNADLRQRVATVIVEFDATKAADQLEKAGKLATLNGFFSSVVSSSVNWETVQIPRDVLVVYVCHNGKNHEAVKEAMKYKEVVKNLGLHALTTGRAPVYENVTFEGAPANGGKLPFVYVLGYENKEPLIKEEVGEKTLENVRKAIAKQRKAMLESDLKWRPFYGYVAEPKHFKDIEKALAKGKPLDSVEEKLKKNLKSSDAEKAKEAQMLYDALEQTRDDLVWFVTCSCSASPHVAAYNLNQVLKYWPKAKKRMAAVASKLKDNSSAQPMIKIYAKIKEWSDPDFVCKNSAEAKKIKAELQKMKKQILPLTSDQSVTIQNGALTLDGMLDELIAVIETKVPVK